MTSILLVFWDFFSWVEEEEAAARHQCYWQVSQPVQFSVGWAEVGRWVRGLQLAVGGFAWSGFVEGRCCPEPAVAAADDDDDGDAAAGGYDDDDEEEDYQEEEEEGDGDYVVLYWSTPSEAPPHPSSEVSFFVQMRCSKQ